MKKIDRLIKGAKKMASDCVVLLFPGNDDGFIDALGVDLELYKHVSSDGAVGYDFLTALNDIAAECWKGEIF